MAPIETGFLSVCVLADRVREFVQIGDRGIGLDRGVPEGEQRGPIQHDAEWGNAPLIPPPRPPVGLGRLLFCSNPRGNNEEGWRGDRYGGFTHPGTWRECVTAAYGLLRQMKKAPAILVPAILVTGVES